MTELYLKQLGLQVLPAGILNTDAIGDELPAGSVDLATYAREQGRRILDLIVDLHDPDAPDINATIPHLKLSAVIDDIVADDLLSLRPKDIDYLAGIEGEYRTNKILRRMGATFYLSKHQQRLSNFTNLLELTWEGDVGIQDFNHGFELSLAACTALEVFSNVKDQALLYLTKLRSGRKNNAILVPILNAIDIGTATNILPIMKKTASDILTHAEDGKIALDGPTLEPILNFTDNRRMRNNKNSSAKKMCYFCGDHTLNLVTHFNTCLGKRSQCVSCGEKGHSKKMCKIVPKKLKPQDINNNYNSTSPSPPDVHFMDLFMVQAKPITYSNDVATVDTGANCFCFRDPSYFVELHLEDGSVNVIDKKCEYSGVGVARVCFYAGGEVYLFPAFYMPGVRINVVCNSPLYEKGIVPNHNPADPHLAFSNGFRVPIDTSTGISTVKLHRVAPQLHLTRAANHSLWHQRILHASDKKLQLMNVLPPHQLQPLDCDTCLQTKSKFTAPTLDHERQEVPNAKLEIVSADLMVPPRGEQGYALVAVDKYSRLTAVVFAGDRSTETLITATRRVFLLFGGAPTKRFVLNREGGFWSEGYRKFLLDNNVPYKFVPTAKHNFNGVAERTIQTLRTMSRSALLQRQVSFKFWFYAVNYAAYVKNLLPHDNLDGLSPYCKFYGQQLQYDTLKVFECLIYKLTPLEQRKNKFFPTSPPAYSSAMIPKQHMELL